MWGMSVAVTAVVHFALGDRLGNYRVERELGSSQTGTSYQAVHVVLPRRAVLKISTLPALAKQLLREACILEALRHPGAPQVYESGLLPDRRPWFAVESVCGITLADRVAQGTLGALETTTLVRDVANVLEHAHRRGVVHRGLRPDRIVLAVHRRFPICIPDWSCARTHDAAHAIPHLPSADAQQFLAPEQLRGDTVDDRADVYALGLIAYFALTGVHPFASLDARRPTRDVVPNAPTELATMIDAMLALDRFDRPSAAEVRSDLDWLASALSSDAAPAAPIEDIELVDTDGVPAVAMPRIRKPRWTPAYAVPATDDYAEIEIAPSKLQD
jgi:serine/threonine-protein kinase